MKTLEYKSIETIDAVASIHLQNAKSTMGMIPNMYLGMANNSALLDAYVKSYETFRENSGFTAQEQEVIFLSIAYENNCDYCVAAHSFVADKMSKLPTEVTNAIRNNSDILNAKFKTLSDFTKLMVSKRGNPSIEDLDTFINGGYTQEHILGVIAGIGIKTMSNYFNHVFHTEVDEAFSSRIWSK
jgi:AhpD family alkylhydroperoxidase